MHYQWVSRLLGNELNDIGAVMAPFAREVLGRTAMTSFSDYKTRGFNLEDSQIERTDCLDRLVLVFSLAQYWAVSTGMWDAIENTEPAEKPPRSNARTSPAP